MKQRSPAAVFILSLITFGIYALVWEVKTKNELNRQGAEVPTAWLLIVPIASLYWIWKYALGVEQVSKGKITAVLTLVLLLLLSVIGMAILQSEFNKLGEGGPIAAGPTPFPAGPPTSPTPPINPAPPVAATPPVAAVTPPTGAGAAPLSDATPPPPSGTISPTGTVPPAAPSSTEPEPPIAPPTV